MRSRVKALWKVVKAWISAKRRPRRQAKPVAAAEVKNPLRLDDTEYLQVMKELDEVLSVSVSVSIPAAAHPEENSPL